MTKSKPPHIPVSFKFDTITIEFIDGGQVRMRVWDVDRNELSTFELEITGKSKEWTMTGNTQSVRTLDQQYTEH